MRVTLARVGPAAFEATAGSGGTVVVDGAPEIGGEGRGMRPMELMLTSIASCAAMDVVHILTKQREPLEALRVEVEGARADAVPAPFTEVRMTFVANAEVNAHKLERAARLGVEKYCSAAASLDPRITLRWESRTE